MTISDWMPVILAIIGGSGGGFLVSLLKLKHEKDESDLKKELDQLSAKAELRRQVDEAAGKIITWYREEFERSTEVVKHIGEQLSSALEKNEQSAAELRQTYAQLTELQEELLRSKTALAVAKKEIDRKEDVIVRLQGEVERLQNMLNGLYEQLECRIPLPQSLLEDAELEEVDTGEDVSVEMLKGNDS